MNKKIAQAQHATAKASHLNLRRRLGAAAVTGCLALSMAPGFALAAPMDQGQAPQGGNPPAMQQGQQPTGQMPEGQQMSDQGQQPEGQPPADSETDAQIRQILSDEYGIEAPELGNQESGQASQFTPGNPGEAPEIPDGEINVQQIIDSVRDAMRYCTGLNLSELDFTDTDFTTALSEYITKAASDREEMFASGEKTFEAQASNEAPEGEAPASTDFAKSSLASSTGSLVDFVVTLFG